MPDSQNASKNVSISRLGLSMIYVLLYPVLLFLISGDIHWVECWIFSAWFLTSTLITLIYLYCKNPDLLAERYLMRGREGQKKWDKYFLYLITVIYFAWFAIMPLDARRFEWTKNFPLWLEALGAIMLFISSFFMFRSLADNTFTSPLIRIQKERNQYVVSTGVYGFVRHPMYLGVISMFIGVPMLLGSYYGTLIGVLLSFLFVIRILGEEKMLEAELEGYIEYKNKVKYRLIPFVW